MERDLVCNMPRMVVSLIRGHSSDSHPCHFAHTGHNLRSSLRAMEWFECTMHITCFHLVVTPLVCIHQEWWVFEHQVCVVQQSICISRRQCWLCLKPFITTMDDMACSCEESFVLLESLRDGIIRECQSESLERCNDLVCMVCGWDAFVEEGSAIDTILIQHSLLECTSPVFC